MSRKSFYMLNKVNVRIGLTALSLIFTIACAESNKNEQKEKLPNEEPKKVEKKNSNLFEVEGKVFSIPSPIQTAFLLKEAGTDYRSSLLNPTEKAGNYATTNQKALNLGIYGADLGYATIYDQSQDAISYMAVSRKMSSELGIDGLFNEALLSRFEANIGNQDSLLVLVSDAFKKADQYLKNNEQKNISVLILAGGWIETLHFATNLAKSSGSEAIRNRIGEQKITIKNLINLLLPFQDDSPMTSNLINQLNELKDIYGGIEFSYTFNPPTTIAEEKTTVINSVSKVDMTDQELSDITDKIEEIRNNITN